MMSSPSDARRSSAEGFVLASWTLTTQVFFMGKLIQIS